MKVPQTPVIASKEELLVLDLENRRTLAESGSLAASEAKKKIEADTEKIKEDIKIGKATIDANNEKINQTNAAIVEVQSLLRKEKQILEEFIKDKDIQKSEIETEITKKIKELADINSEILTFSKSHENNKLVKAQEIAGIEEQKKSLVAEIEKLEIKKREVIAEIATFKEKLDTLEKNIKKLQEEKTALESVIASLKDTIENQKGIIENNKVILNQQSTKMGEQDVEIMALDEKIAKKEAEYKMVESQAFAILNKQQLLDSKEAFIKSQYERAGIKWEE